MALVLNDSQKCGTEVLLQPPGTKCMPVYARMRMEMHGEQHSFLTSGSLDPRAAEAREEYKDQWAFETLKSMDDKNTHTLFFVACYVSARPSCDACPEFRRPPNIQSIVVGHVMLS